MFATSPNHISVTPYGNLMQFFSQAFGKSPEKEKQTTEQEKTTAPFWEGVEHVFPSFSDNLAKAFSKQEEPVQNEKQSAQTTVITTVTDTAKENKTVS